MFRIGRMPHSCKRFLTAVPKNFTNSGWEHFWRLVTAMMISSAIIIDRLSALLDNGTHRTKHGEFLWKGD